MRRLRHSWMSLTLLLTGCNGLSVGGSSGSGGDDGGGGGVEVVRPARFPNVATEPRQVTGRILAEDGTPLAGATVLATGFQAGQPAAVATTGSDGRYLLDGLVDANALLKVTADGFRSEILAVSTQEDVTVVALDDQVLVALGTGRTRLLLAGDTMFGRRFEDRDEDGDRGETGDLIRPGSRAADAEHLLRFLRPLLRVADYRVVNFESPAATPDTPLHAYKEFAFSSHPDTLEALAAVGIEAVSLGNNHAYDALDDGMVQTLAACAAHGVAAFGAGADNQTSAQASTLAVDLGQTGEVPLLFQGFNGILPNSFLRPPPTGEDWRYRYSAMDADPVAGSGDKGGALWLSVDNLDHFLDRDPARWHVPVLHGGHEYGEYPSVNMRARFRQALAATACEVPLVVAHHPHTVYGVGVVQHGDGATTRERAVLCSLGNFLFDQDVYETFRGVVALVDLATDADGLPRLHRIELLPFHQEDYVPSPLAGADAQWLARHLGHLSTFLSDAAYGNADDGLLGAVVFAEPGGIAVCVRPEEYATEAVPDLVIETALDSGGGDAFPLLDPDLPLASVQRWTGGPPGSRLRLGRDLLRAGDCEDHDVDDRRFETAAWFSDENRYPSPGAARSGRVGMAAFLPAGNSFTGIHFTNRITFVDNAELELVAWVRTSNAGVVAAQATWIQRNTRDELGTVILPLLAGGTRDWTRVQAVLSPPAGAGHLRLSLLLDAPADGSAATVHLDDAALILWEGSIAPGDTVVPTAVPSIGAGGPLPHGFDWARLEDAGSASATTLRLSRVVFRRAAQPEGLVLGLSPSLQQQK